MYMEWEENSKAERKCSVIPNTAFATADWSIHGIATTNMYCQIKSSYAAKEETSNH